MYESEDSEDTNELYSTSFTIDEIKTLVLAEIPAAQDLNSMFHLSRLKIFNHYHKKIEDYFKRCKNKKPSMADKLAYIILLSYPETFIRNADSFDCFKLFTRNKDKKSDFKIVQIIDSEFNEGDEHHEDRHDCICSYKNLKNIYIVENIFTEIRLCVGCECIKTYGLVSKEEMSENKKLMDELKKKNKERQQEKEEGKPDGYYEEQRQQLFLKKNEAKEAKKKKKELKDLEKINTGNYRRCYKCDNSLINIKHNKNIRFCNKCMENKDLVDLFDRNKLLVDSFKKVYENSDCANCENVFTSKKTNCDYFCKICKIDKKIIDCKWCHVSFVDNIISNDIYCDNCVDRIGNCIDCQKDFKRNSINIDRCGSCQNKYDNKLIVVNCEKCKQCFSRKQKDNIRSYCNICYKDIVDKTPICKCKKQMVLRSNQKEGPNKGTKFFGCSSYPLCKHTIAIK